MILYPQSSELQNPMKKSSVQPPQTLCFLSYVGVDKNHGGSASAALEPQLLVMPAASCSNSPRRSLATVKVVRSLPGVVGGVASQRSVSDPRVAVRRQSLPVGAVVASAAEPKWKQKLKAAEEHAEKTRRATAQAQEEYKKRQAQIRRQQDSASSDIVSLGSLEYIPYLTEEGKIVDCSKADAKATVYAIFDDAKALQYVGVTRAVYPSMRLHFARVTSKCFYAKVVHLAQPSRSLLESIADKWIADNGFSPPGNDNGEQQNIWENPLDCKPLMTDKEKQIVEEAAPGPPTAKALKNVARRIEAGLLEVFKERNCTEKMRFDPKLKDTCLLDLKNSDPKTVKREPDTAVPTTNVNPATVGVALV